MADDKLYRLVYLRCGELHQLGSPSKHLGAIRGNRTRLRNMKSGYITAIQVLNADWKGLE